MIENLPIIISAIFVLTTLATLLLFYFAVVKSVLDNVRRKANLIMLFSILWLIVQAVLAYGGFYLDTKGIPPKFIFAVLPLLLLIAVLFITVKGRVFIDGISLKYITYLNTVRLPVELVLYWLFLNKAVPEIMTFAGRNFDVLAGITAPFIAFYGFTKKKLSRKIILTWNIICLVLLFNIIATAVLSAPFSFQVFAFDQPNIAVLYFPFIWLPSFIVPIVFFGHLISVRQLMKVN